jgi:hypothetical protein
MAFRYWKNGCCPTAGDGGRSWAIAVSGTGEWMIGVGGFAVVVAAVGRRFPLDDGAFDERGMSRRQIEKGEV